MRPLTPDLGLGDGESATSYAARLTQFHTGQTGLRVVQDLAIDLGAFLKGEAHAVEALAHAAGISPTELRSCSIARFSRHREFNGERLARDFVRPDGARFCASCLLEDGDRSTDRYARLLWRFRPVRLCLRHGAVLSAAETNAIGDRPLPFPGTPELERLASRAISADPTPMDRWIADRVLRQPMDQGTFLARQTLEQGVKVCEMLGATLDHGLDVTISRLSEAQLADSAAEAFEIVRQGDEAVMEALTAVRAMSVSNAGQAKFRAFYGNLYEWVRATGGDVGPGPIRDLLRDHIKARTALGLGDTVLGEEISERTMHSAYTLSRATRLHPKRLRKILVRLGIAPENCDDLDYNLLVFPVGETEQLCLDLHEAVPLSGLPGDLGCSRAQAESLCRSGFINPVVPPGEGIGRIDYARREITRVLSWLEGLPVWAPADGVDLTRAAKMTSLSTGDLLAGIRDGTIGAGRMPGAPWISAIRIRKSDIRRLQLETRGPPVSA
ncbi:TniQ family protein [Wenxinia saemankumensis]|uniref:TniQ protein n=1 Tax=Wenxinia saemankumensis TaxID=1447782 RepID=A0A1M6I3Z8_9RHOB|nr:TniQ family protein [Wenxinia saemankumensis]SHJ29176.1 TniQ protein [Wenxinia saemankumensis]